MNCKDLAEIADTIGFLAALGADLRHIRDWSDFQLAQETMLKHLKLAEDAVDRVALGIHRKGVTVQ